jgi:hypothetical protein
MRTSRFTINDTDTRSEYFFFWKTKFPPINLEETSRTLEKVYHTHRMLLTVIEINDYPKLQHLRLTS